MLKTLGVLVGGVFVGAVAVEILRKNRPELLDKFYEETFNIGRGIKRAFAEGYQRTAQAGKTMPATEEAPA